MNVKTLFLRPLAIAALLATAGASHAAFINTFSSLAAFNAATVQQGTDTYAGLSITSSTLSPLNRSTTTGTGYNYVASVLDPNTTQVPPPPTLFFGGGTTANPFLSTNTATDIIVLNGFSPQIRAIGGNFFGSDVGGAFTLGTIRVTVTDSLGVIFAQTLVNPAQNAFQGVLSNGFITSMTIATLQPNTGFVWPSVDNLVVAIPEPGTYALMLAGLGVVGLMTRRRKV